MAASFPSLSPHRALLLLLLTILSSLSFSSAQSTSASTTSTAITASTTATPFPGNSDWTYHGCYGETTLTNGTNGARALAGGVEETLDDMNVAMCLAFCKSNGYAIAGLEYSRECYCAQHLSAVSVSYADGECNLACQGNSSQSCGGDLKLSVYEAKSDTNSVGSRDVKVAPVESILALGIAIGVALCLA